MPQAPVVALALALEVDDERAVALADRADRLVVGEHARPRDARERVDRNGVGEGHRQNGGPLARERADHLVEMAGHHVEVAVAAQGVVQPRDDGAEVRLERQRGVELLLADLARELAAHREVRVEQAVAAARDLLSQAVGPAAEAATVRVRVHQALGRAVTDRDVALERHAHRLESVLA